jgi:hypothetical protein
MSLRFGINAAENKHERGRIVSVKKPKVSLNAIKLQHMLQFDVDVSAVRRGRGGVRDRAGFRTMK